MFKFFLGKLGELVSSRVVETFWAKVVDRTADDAVNNISRINNFDLNFKTLLQDLKSLSAMASDVKDQIKSQELSGRKKRKRQVEVWLERVKSVEEEVVELETRVESEGYAARLEDGGNVEKLNEQVLKLVEQGRDFGELVLDVCGSSGEKLLTNGMVGEAFNENLETIMQLLETREVSRIGVYGMGGVGKTTLAKHINNRLLQSVGRVLWVTVSQEFTITSLQEKIAHLIGVDLSHEAEIPKRAMRLHSALSEMKDSVLILDDVWENIDLLEVGCSLSRDCCRLIITTRSLEVCRQIRCGKVFRVDKLGEEEAWKLFVETLGNEIELGPQVIEIAKSVAKLCDGLPLGIITVAGSMRGEKAIHTWKNALAELKESVVGLDGMGDIKVFKVLKYSFDRLKRKDERDNNELNMIQRCFMFCSLYPEDYAIYRDDLVRYFISDGLLDEKRSRRAQLEQGHSILDKLVNLCLLESYVDYKNSEYVKMHDLVRGMALKIGEGKYMVRVGHMSLKDIYVPDGKEWTKYLEKVSFKMSTIGRIEDEASPDCPNLSSLFLWANKLNYIPDSFFSKMRGLCNLNLSWNPDMEMIPDTIGHMTSLKALLLEGCEKLENVPYLGKLKAMRELNLSGTAIKEVPRGVEELSNLRVFSINAPELMLFPKGLLLKLVHLEHLSLTFHMQVEIEEIENLKRLEEFCGGLKTVSDFNWFISNRVPHPSYRIAVNLENAHPFLQRRKGGDLGGKNNELVLCKTNLSGEKVLGQGIAYLTITNCEGLSKCFVDDLSRLDNPISLKSVCIEHCGGTEYILRSSDGEGLAASQFSNTLEEIHLLGLDDMKVVAQRGETVDAASGVPAQPLFSFLKKLTISSCNKTGKVGLPASGFPNLEILHIHSCEEIEEIFTEDEGRAASIVTALPKLQDLTLWNLPKLKKVGLRVSGVPNLVSLSIVNCRKMEEIFQDDIGRNPVTTLPRLIWLDLEDLPRVESVSKATIICNSSFRISIKRCPILINKLPLHMDVPLPPFLEEIRVEREWWESLEWDTHPNLPQLLLPFVQFQD